MYSLVTSQDGISNMGQMVMALISVEVRAVHLDVGGYLLPSLEPTLISVQDLDVHLDLMGWPWS